MAKKVKNVRSKPLFQLRAETDALGFVVGLYNLPLTYLPPGKINCRRGYAEGLLGKAEVPQHTPLSDLFSCASEYVARQDNARLPDIKGLPMDSTVGEVLEDFVVRFNLHGANLLLNSLSHGKPLPESVAASYALPLIMEHFKAAGHEVDEITMARLVKLEKKVNEQPSVPTDKDSQTGLLPLLRCGIHPV